MPAHSWRMEFKACAMGQNGVARRVSGRAHGQTRRCDHVEL